jgi:hypothetical protein
MMAYYVEHRDRVPEVVFRDGVRVVRRRDILDGNGVDKWNGIIEQEGYARLAEWHPDPHGVGELRVRVQRLSA